MKIKKILVSQPKPTTEKSPYYAIAEQYNVQIDFKPFIKVEPVSVSEFLSQKINIPDYTAIIFTSKTAIDHYFCLCKELRIPVSESIRYFCLSEAIACYLGKYIVYRKRKVFSSASGKLKDLMIPIHKHNRENFLVPASDVHGTELFCLLDKKAIKYDIAIMYRTVSNEFTQNEKLDYDVLLFFSPSGISSLLKNFPNFEQKDIVIGTFGKTTAQAVKDAGLRLDIEAPSADVPSMTAALENYLKKQIEIS